MLPCRAPQSIFCLLGFFSALWAQKRDVIFHMSNLSFSVSLDLVHLLPFLAFLWSEREVLWLILYDILLLGESHLSFCQQPWQPFCEGGDCKSKSSLVPGRKNTPPMNHLTKIFPGATARGEHKYWPRTDIIADICSTGVDAGNPHVQKVFPCLMPMSLVRVQCVTAFEICATIFMLGVSFTQ